MVKYSIYLGAYNDVAHLECAESRRLCMSFSKTAQYLVAKTESGQIIGCSGWKSLKNSVRLGPSFVIPAYRRCGIFKTLDRERMAIIGRGKPLIANVTEFSIKHHLNNGAKILKTYKYPSYLIEYEVKNG